ILFASRLVWEKNIQTLIHIYQHLAEENKDYNLIIAGDGPAKIVAENQMPNAIFLGKLAHGELAKIYASTDVFVFPSTSETYGNVVIEAMAAGLPCVIANGGGSANLIQHYQTGFKCEPNNAQEYVYFIHKIISNNTLREKIQQAALRYVNSLNWANLTDQYFKEVQELSPSKQPAFSWATQ
ncbi:MAG: glycosyltransferase, partial [Sphingobacterium sp.]